MNTYARLDSGHIAELLTTAADVKNLFHPALHWIDVTAHDVAVGDIVSGAGFVRPTPRPLPAMQDLQAEIAALTLRVAALSKPA